MRALTTANTALTTANTALTTANEAKVAFDSMDLKLADISTDPGVLLNLQPVEFPPPNPIDGDIYRSRQADGDLFIFKSNEWYKIMLVQSSGICQDGKNLEQQFKNFYSTEDIEDIQNLLKTLYEFFGPDFCLIGNHETVLNDIKSVNPKYNILDLDKKITGELLKNKTSGNNYILDCINKLNYYLSIDCSPFHPRNLLKCWSNGLDLGMHECALIPKTTQQILRQNKWGINLGSSEMFNLPPIYCFFRLDKSNGDDSDDDSDCRPGMLC